MMLTVKTKASKFLACLLAVVVAFGVIPVGMVFTAAAATIDGYTITLTDGTNVIDTLNDVEVTLTNDADNQLTATATTVNGVATFDGFVEENVSYTATIEAITGYDSTWSVQFTYDEVANPGVTNADIVLTALDEIVISGVVTDENDAPYANATVKISGYVTGETTTDADGKYSFNAYKGKNYTIEATAKDDKYETATTTVSAPAADYECTALKFAIKKFTVSTSAGENGTITATETVDYGSSKEITATANDGYRIDSFVVDGNEIAEAKGAQTYSYELKNIIEAQSVSVTFIRQTYKITFTVSDKGNVTYNDGTQQTIAGEVAVFNESTDPANPTKVQITATPNENYRVSKVVIDGNEPQNFNENDKDFSTELEMTADHTFTVEFALNVFNVTVTNGINGTATVDKEQVEYDGTATVTITPNEGYNIDAVLVNGTETNNITMNSDETSYNMVIGNITEHTNIEITYSQIPVISMNNVTLNSSEAIKVFEDANSITYIYKNDGKAIFTTTKDGIRINKDKTTGKAWYTPTWTIKKSTVVTKLEVFSNLDWSEIKLDKTIKIIIDKDAPEIDNANVPDWTNADYVTITGDATDVIPRVTSDENPSSGLSYVVWNKGSELTEAEVVDPTNPNRVIPDADGKFSFNSVEGEQNSKYYIYAVDVAGNISKATEVEVKIDKKAPTIENFTFSTKENTILQDAIKFLSFGTICAEKMYVTVSANDEEISSKLKEITLYIDGDAFETKTVSGDSATFELTEKKFKEGAEISATVVDKAGNVSAEKEHDNIVRIDGTTKPTIEFAPETAVYTDDKDGKLWYAGNLSVNVTAGEENTGIRSVKIELNGTEITTEADGTPINADYSNTQVNSLNFEINTSQNAKDGENIVKVTVVNNAGVKTEKVQKVYIDTTKPDVTNFKFTRENDAPLDKVLNILTFGVFFNDKVEITVTADDKNATSGVKEITLYADGVEFETKDVVDNKATFTIPVEDIADNTLHFNKTISATATDNVGNTTEVEVFPDTSNSNVEDSKLMIETIKPTIEVSCADAASEKNTATADANDWYNNDVVFTVDVADENAGIRNTLITINGKELVNVNYYNDNETDTETHEETYTVSTADADREDDGSYTLEVIVTDNAGNVSETYSKTIYKDTDKPYITGFDFEAENYVEGDETASTVEVTDYGFYFKVDTKVVISAKDNDPTAGIKNITYYTVDKDTGESLPIVATVNENGQIEFVIRANFKGQIYAKATDNVGNTTDVFVNPNSAVVENEEKHNEETHISFEKAETNYTANDGTELYATDVPVKITVVDTYSGIRSIEWEVVAPYDADNNQSGKVTVNNDLTYAEGSDEGWNNVETDVNLVTKMEKTITVANNSNNIIVSVTMTDRAGNITTDSIELSIDKIAPVIDIVYDNNEADSENATFYKADREATITITERNFRAEDVVFEITNTDEVIPEINLNDATVWTKVEVEEGENPDNTTYTAEINYTADGDYTFDIAYKDNAENPANTIEQHAFTIDKTLPVITIVYDNNDAQNGNYYKADRIATLTIVEHNFDPARVKNIGFATDSATGTPVATTFPTISAWQNVGTDTYVATIAYTADSKYTFDIEFNDMAGNSIVDYTPVEFYVDKTAPTLEISGVADKSANKGTVAPIVTYSDTNFNVDGVTITLTGINNGKVNYSAAYAPITNGQTYTYANFEEVQKVDDIYTLTAKLVDMAGNETEQTITFSANRFGSVYDLTEIEDILGKYLTTEQDIVFTETNVDSLDRDGILIKLTKNGTPTDLIEGVDYTVETSGGNGRWSVYKYTIKKALFAGDGRYSVSVYSTDAAGNVNENIDETKSAEISFGIDKTTPVIVPIDFESNEQYDVEMKTVSVEIKDNLVLEGVKIYLNGKEIEYTVDGETYTFNIPESNDKQDVKIVVVDAAGNEQVIEVNGFTVSTNFFVRWFNNTPVFIGSIVAMVVLALGVTIFFVFFKKKKKNEDEQ